MLVTFLISFLLPLFFIGTLWKAKDKNLTDWLLKLLLVTALLLFVYLIGRWDFLSYYFRYIFAILFLLATYFSFRNIPDRQLHIPKDGKSIFSVLFNLLIIGFMGYLSFLAVKGFSPDRDAVALEFPLKNGTYYIGGGGNSRLINNHQVQFSQRYAIDVLKLNGYGANANLFPGSLDDYEIWGDSLYSPCDGVVLLAVDQFPDAPGANRDFENPAGNHVVISYQGHKVVMAHFRQGSIVVASGDTVSSGQYLGQVGNSGNTSQPHLHLHIETGGGELEILSGNGVPMSFDGKFLVRNDLVRRNQ